MKKSIELFLLLTFMLVRKVAGNFSDYDDCYSNMGWGLGRGRRRGSTNDPKKKKDTALTNSRSIRHEDHHVKPVTHHQKQPHHKKETKKSLKKKKEEEDDRPENELSPFLDVHMRSKYYFGYPVWPALM